MSGPFCVWGLSYRLRRFGRRGALGTHLVARCHCRLYFVGGDLAVFVGVDHVKMFNERTLCLTPLNEAVLVRIEELENLFYAGPALGGWWCILRHRCG